MRYVLIVMFLFSASVQAEEWESIVGSENIGVYFADLEFNHGNDTFMIKVLTDDIQHETWDSMVQHYQIKCVDKKVKKYRMFYTALYEGRMATRDVTYHADGAPWLPTDKYVGLFHFNEICEYIASPPRNPLY